MSTFWSQLSALITTPPGNLSYHLVLTFAIGGTLALLYFRDGQRLIPPHRRAALGLGLLLLLRLIHFLSAWALWSGVGDPHTWLPVMDRAFAALGLLILFWIWGFPNRLSNVDIATALLGAFLLTFAGLTLGLWRGGNNALAFNQYWLDGAWAGLSLVLALGGSAWLLWQRPPQWETGLAMLLLLGIGHLVHLLAPNVDSDFPAAVRLTQLAAYPLLLLLADRFQPLPSILPSATTGVSDRPITSERRRYTAAPKTLQAVLALLGSRSGEELCHHLVTAMARTMVADLCLLISPPDSSGTLNVHCGYDLIRETEIEGLAVDRDRVPLLAMALEKNRLLRLPASSTASDLINLGQLLGLGHTGHLLLAPIPHPDHGVLAGLILLSPYARRTWTTADQDYLSPLLPLLGKIILQQRARQQTAESPQPAEEEAPESPTQAESQQESVNLLAEELDRAHQALASLERENRELYENLTRAEEEAQTTVQQLQTALEQAQAELSQLRERLQETEQRLEEMQQITVDREQEPLQFNAEQRELITSLVQELRQPMSSIVGYTDLLLGESVGILGALQRKFLERTKASITRMEGLLDDLIRVATNTPEDVQIQAAPVNLAEVIDQAIAQIQQHLREKSILLKVDLPDELPQLIADRDALHQILMHLLNNAALVTPENGEIALKSAQVAQNGEQFLLIQVTDSGGGIPEKDIPRVFSRLYRADNPLIEGVGDTGVGLSIAKALTEAQHGRIWVESETGKGATFSVMLPLSPPTGEGETESS